MTTANPQSAVNRREAELLVREAVAGDRLDATAALRLAASVSDEGVREAIFAGASESKLRGKGDVVTVSRNIFIPLTNLCRNRCTYCTFAKPPDSPEAKTYDLDEVADFVRGGVATGCIEALLCLGDKPEVAYRSHREWLSERSFASTTEHLAAAAQTILATGMLPHTNAGILSQEEMVLLRPLNASMGLMLETTSERLCEKGMPHFHAPDKKPEVRLRMHREAGELKIPFTSGILMGIGETESERIDTLFAIRALDDEYGHIQEAIIQPFHPKPGTRMRAASPMRDEEIAAWVGLARLILGSEMNVQAPPNLSPAALEMLLRSGVNDWGGVSPVTVDFINPEAPWPALRALQERTEAAGQRLRERLPVYPNWVTDRPEFFDPQMREHLSRFANDEGYARLPNHQSDQEAAQCSNDSIPKSNPVWPRSSMEL